MKAHRLHRDDRLSYAMLPAVLDRVMRFARERDSDASPEFLRRALVQHFASDDPSVVAFVAYDEAAHAVRGHVLVSRDKWCDSPPFVTVLQYLLDESVPFTWLREAFGLVEEFARETGATEIRCYAAQEYDEDRRRARAFRAFHGFKEKRVLMTKPVSSHKTNEARDEGARAQTLTARAPECEIPT